MDTKVNSNQKSRLIIGTIILIIGFASPLLIPVISNSQLPIGWKTSISGFLVLGIPELFMVISVAIMGKSGFDFLKSKFVGFLKPFAPPDKVSINRYRFGLVMFLLPIFVWLLHPYLAHFFSELKDIPTWYYIISDVIFFLSLFVLGGDFWDKLSGLFKHDKKISKQKEF